MITAGVDVGAKYVKTVLLEDGKNILKRADGIVEFDVLKSTTEVFEKALLGAGLKRDQIVQVVATGMGRKAVHKKPPVNPGEIIPEVIADLH